MVLITMQPYMYSQYRLYSCPTVIGDESQGMFEITVLRSGISVLYEKIASERSREEEHNYFVSFSNEQKNSIYNSRDSLT